MLLESACSFLHATYWSQMLSGEWRCSWSSANRPCSNYIWLINNLIAYKGASYIRDLTVHQAKQLLSSCCLYHMRTITEANILSFWWYFHLWLHWKLSFRQLPVQSVKKMSSKRRHNNFNEEGWNDAENNWWKFSWQNHINLGLS